MQAAHFRTRPPSSRRLPNELLGFVVLALIATGVLVAFAISPLGTVAAGIVAVVAYPLAGRNFSGSVPLRFAQRASLAIATIGVGMAFLLF